MKNLANRFIGSLTAKQRRDFTKALVEGEKLSPEDQETEALRVANKFHSLFKNHGLLEEIKEADLDSFVEEVYKLLNLPQIDPLRAVFEKRVTEQQQTRQKSLAERIKAERKFNF